MVGARGAAQDAADAGAARRADPDPCRPDPADVALGARVPALLEGRDLLGQHPARAPPGALQLGRAEGDPRRIPASRYDRVEGGALKVYSDQKSLDEAVAVSERQRPLGLEFRVLDRKGCLELVPALAPRIETLAGGIHFAAEEGGDCFKFCEGLAAWCAERGAVLGFGTRVERLAAEDAADHRRPYRARRVRGRRLRPGARRRQPAPDAPARRAAADHPGQGLQHHRAQGAVPGAADHPGARRAAQVRHDAAAGPPADERPRRDRGLRHGARGAPHARRSSRASPACSPSSSSASRPRAIRSRSAACAR